MKPAFWIPVFVLLAGSLNGQPHTINNDLVVTGNTQSDGATLSHGSQSGSYGAATIYQNADVDTLTFSINRNPASWLWIHHNGVPAMRLNKLHELLLYRHDGAAAGITLLPGDGTGTHKPQLSLGTATLIANGQDLTTSGALTVAGGLTNTTGVFTGGATGLTLNAGGSNQSITLNSSGTGDLVFRTGGTEQMRIKASGSIGIGTSTPDGKVEVSGGHLTVSGMFNPYLLLKSSATGSPYGFLQYIQTEGNYMRLYDGSSYAMVWRSGNVGIGTSMPTARLHVSHGDIHLADTYNQTPFIIKSYANAGSLWLMPAAGDSVTTVLGTSHDWDRGVSLRYTPGSSGAGGGHFVIGQTHKNASAYTHGMTSFYTMGAERMRLDGTGNLKVQGTVQARTSFDGILQVGPFGASPTYFYINTKIPFSDGVAPQVRVTGYLYSSSNKAMDIRLGWYMWSGNFYWTQYHSELGYAKPSRVRLGTYNDAGTTRVRIEIANDGVYWANYAISAVDPLGQIADYSNWGYGEGAMPGGTGHVTEVPLQGDVVVHGKLSLGHTQFAAMSHDVAGWLLRDARSDNTQPRGLFTPDGYGLSLVVNNDARLTVADGGNVGIGTTSPSHRLTVNGTIRAKEVIVDTGWADYVFDEDYRLAPLSEVEAHIRAKKHLPGIPSAAEVEAQGVSMGEMQSKMMAKIEELTLHLIAQEKRLNQLETENRALRAQLAGP